jgi:hypothetical protein
LGAARQKQLIDIGEVPVNEVEAARKTGKFPTGSGQIAFIPVDSNQSAPRTQPLSQDNGVASQPYGAVNQALIGPRVEKLEHRIDKHRYVI